MDKHRKRLWLRFCGFTLAWIAGGYFIYYSWQHVASLPRLDWSLESLLALVAGVMLCASCIVLGGMVWLFLLRNYGVEIGWRQAQNIYGRAQFGKYLPGNIGHHVGRTVLGKEAGIPVTVTIQTLLMENVWGVALGAGASLLTSMYVTMPDAFGGISFQGSGTIFLLFIAALILPLLVFKFIIVCLPNLANKLAGGGKFQVPGISTITGVMVLILLSFLLNGLALDIMARHLFAYPDSEALLLTGIFSWAWIAGYLTPGAPAGLGVREAILLTALTPIYGAGTAIGLSLSLRVATTLGDGLVFLITFLRAPGQPRPNQRPRPEQPKLP